MVKPGGQNHPNLQPVNLPSAWSLKDPSKQHTVFSKGIQVSLKLQLSVYIYGHLQGNVRLMVKFTLNNSP